MVVSFLDAMLEGDFEKAAEFVNPDEDNSKDIEEMSIIEDEEGERLFRAILDKTSYEIGEKTIDGNKATVTAKITAPDLLRIVSQTMSELIPMAFAMAFSEEEADDKMDAMIQQYFENAISDPNAPMTVSDTQIKLEKIDGTWFVIPDDELINALTGNLEKAFASLEEE